MLGAMAIVAVMEGIMIWIGGKRSNRLSKQLLRRGLQGRLDPPTFRTSLRRSPHVVTTAGTMARPDERPVFSELDADNEVPNARPNADNHQDHDEYRGQDDPDVIGGFENVHLPQTA